MFARNTLIKSNILAKPLNVEARGMATARQLRNRIKSVTGLRKITKAMNLIAAAKVRKSQMQLDRARVFSRFLVDLWPEPAKEDCKLDPNSDLMFVAVVADRGLCGAANSAIIKDVKRTINGVAASGTPKNAQLVVYGEKGKSGLERQYKKYFTTTLSDLAKLKSGLSFKQVCELTNYILSRKFDNGLIFYNRFKNMMSYFTTSVPLLPAEKSIEAAKLDEYELEGDNDVLQNLYEFRLASRMYLYFAEADTTEQSARTTAMAASSKSADEMLADLNLKYNRQRQGKITQELLEIVAGVAGLKKVRAASA